MYTSRVRKEQQTSLLTIVPQTPLFLALLFGVTYRALYASKARHNNSVLPVGKILHRTDEHVL